MLGQNTKPYRFMMSAHNSRTPGIKKTVHLGEDSAANAQQSPQWRQQHQQQDSLEIMMSSHDAYADEIGLIRDRPRPPLGPPPSPPIFLLGKTISRSYDLRTIDKYCAPIKGLRTTQELLELFARNEKGSKENSLLFNETLIAEWREFDALRAHLRIRKTRFLVLMSPRMLGSLRAGDGLVKACSEDSNPYENAII